MKTVIITDSCSDLPLEFVEQYQIPVVNMNFRLGDNDYLDDFGKTISYKQFYDAVRDGQMSTTSQVNVQDFIDIYRKYVQKGVSLIYICFSSALSGTYNNAVIARNMILEEYPTADITVIDTKAASMGEGILVHHAVKMLENGASKEKIVDWVENNKLRIAHWVTVEDLNHLKRGGRLTGAAAFVGTVLNIKPIIHVDNDGRLVPVGKIKGRKKSIRTLVEKMEKTIQNPEEQTIFINHGDSPDDANYMADLIRSKFKVKDIIINHIGPVIGSHSGPGTLALFFIGSER